MMINRLEEYRWEAGLSRQQLAIKAGVGATLIKRLEKNIKMGVGMENGLKLARALKKDPRDVFIVKR